MIDPIISLAFGVFSNKGVYALLVGSGVSRGAGIPTGWEVMEDLIRKVAVLENADNGSDPLARYVSVHGQPSYDTLLDALTKSPVERSAMLKPYFEPTDAEREDGLKSPTAGHKAIARLVRGGYINVVITINFDRLLETAIEDEGVVPVVLATVDAVEGAMPVVHSRCTVIKLHGDYLDPRSKNTPSELEQYDKPVEELLDRILDEYGLIVCGWSAEYDTALRAALERRRSRRFPLYWALKGELGEHAKRLTTHLGAQIVPIESADDFFTDLSGKVESLEESSTPHPLSTIAAVASLKRYLVDKRHKIQLEDLVSIETERLYEVLNDTEKYPKRNPSDSNSLVQLTDQYRENADTLIQLMAAGCRWGESYQSHVWSRCIERIANGPDSPWQDVRLYPALILLYAGGITAVRNNRYHNLFAILRQAFFRDFHGEVCICEKVSADVVLEKSLASKFPNLNKRYTPASDHLFGVLRTILAEHLNSQAEYEKAFDRFEVFCALANTELNIPTRKEGSLRISPLGRYAWNYRSSRSRFPLSYIKEEEAAAGKEWDAYKAGFFGANRDTFKAVVEQFESSLVQASHWMI